MFSAKKTKLLNFKKIHVFDTNGFKEKMFILHLCIVNK